MALLLAIMRAGRQKSASRILEDFDELHENYDQTKVILNTLVCCCCLVLQGHVRGQIKSLILMERMLLQRKRMPGMDNEGYIRDGTLEKVLC